MKVQPVDTPGGERYLLLDDEYEVVSEVHEFLKHCDNIGSSETSQRTYCYHLKLYYDYLNIIGLKYDEIFDKTKTDGKGPVKILSDFIAWLQYPDRFNGILHLEGETAARQISSVNGIINAVVKFYDYMARNKYIDELDVYKATFGRPKFQGFLSELNKKDIHINKNILKLKEPKRKIKYITHEQYMSMYNQLNDERDKAIVGVLFFAGIRLSELIALRISDIDFKENTINVKQHDNSAIRDAHLKNNSEGYIYVPNIVMLDIANYIHKHKTTDNSDVLFVNLYGETKGQPLSKGNVESIIAKCGRKIGIHLTPHMLRHSYAVSHLNEGDQLRDVQDNLRHKQIQTTLIYVDIIDDTKKEQSLEYYKKIKEDFSPYGTTLDDIGGKLL